MSSSHLSARYAMSIEISQENAKIMESIKEKKMAKPNTNIGVAKTTSDLLCSSKAQVQG
jgi:hypothetical protein